MSEDDEGATASLGLNRTLALSDGVFAIAMTLLAFQLQPPDLRGPQLHHLARALGAMGDRYYVYLLSFMVIGGVWLAHHRLFVHVRQVDEFLMLGNVVFLVTVAVLLFPTAVLGRYGNQPTAIALYAAVMALTGSLLTLLMLAARHRGLLSAAASGAKLRASLWRSVSMVVVFGLSIPVAFIAPRVAPFTWLTLFVLRAALRRRAAGRPA